MKENNIRVTPDPKETGQVLPTPSPEPVERPISVPDVEVNHAEGFPPSTSESAGVEVKPPEGSSPTPGSAKAPVSQRKLQANRRNSKKSKGPTSKDGKARSSQNAYKHGFFARALFQNAEQRQDIQEYNRLHSSLWEEFKPASFREKLQIERIATDSLRLARLMRYEQQNYKNTIAANNGQLVRYITAVDRQLEKKTQQMERLQEKRKSESASLDLPEPESDENDDDAPTQEPVPPDGDGAGSATIVLPLDEHTADEVLDAVAKPTETQNAGTKPTVKSQASQRLARRRPRRIVVNPTRRRSQSRRR